MSAKQERRAAREAVASYQQAQLALLTATRWSNAIIVRQTLVHDIPSIMSRIGVRLDATQTAPTAGDHASAAEGAAGVAPRTDTGAILEARADKLDRA